MASTFQLFLDKKAIDDDFYQSMGSLEVEENIDLPGAFQFTLPVSRTGDGDLTYVSEDLIKPFTNVAVVATPDGGSDQCIFDGFILSHKLHVQTGIVNSTLEVWGQDASWLMNLEEKVKEWVNVTDAAAANEIFGSYGITPSPDNFTDDSPSHTEDGHSLMQRSSDIQFLRRLARANGKFCRVACADKPGNRIGYFAKPKLDGDPAVTLTLNDPEVWTVESLDLTWDVMRPTAVKARQALFNDSDENGVSGDTSDSGFKLLDAQSLAAFSGKTMTVLLTTPVDDGGELSLRAQAVLRDADWFVRCEGEADVSRLNAVLRVGDLVQIQGVGSFHSGTYLVWSVRHTMSSDAHKMKFVLMRNAIGPPPSSGGGGLLGGLL
jgi:phage protein D